MFFKERKIGERIKELNNYRYKDPLKIENWTVWEDKTKSEKYPGETLEKKDFKKGDHWSGRDYYLWIETSMEIPKKNPQVRQLFYFDFGRTGGGYNSGFESLLFIDNVPYQGVDSNHKEVFIDPEYYGKTLKISLRLWSGLEGGGPEQIQSHQFICADLYELDEPADDFFFTADIMEKTIAQLQDNVPEKQQLLNVLNKSINQLDWTNPGSDEFYHSVYRADQTLQNYLKEVDPTSLVNIYAIGHTHIDVAWLWRLKHTREKAARSFSTVLRLMEQYPDYIFLQTQPQLYQFIKEDYPEIYQKIKARIDEGRWEVDGGMWLEADCNIPSGESLVRQILKGKQFIKQEFNRDIHYLWLPDVFGYSWALPQILKKSGIDTFMTTKISWNQYNRMPNDTFIWKGIDGSEILTHFITTPTSIDMTKDTWYYTYNGDLEPYTVTGIYEAYRDKDLNSDLLLSYGYGDGGGGVTRDMLEKRRRLDQMPVIPNVKTGRADDYFRRLHKNIESTQNYVHTWDGELYLEYHRGTYTSQAFVKKMNRKLELRYRETEILTALLFDKKKANELKNHLDPGWQILLRNQFHDIIPGSSIKEVYEDNKIEYQKAGDIAQEILSQAANCFSNEKDTYTIFNSAGWKRSDLVTISENRPGRFVDEKHDLLESSYNGLAHTLLIPNISGLGTKTVRFIEAETTKTSREWFEYSTSLNQLSTPFYEVVWNDRGEMTGLFDVENQRNVLKEAGLGNYFTLSEDKPINYDAWDIDLFYVEKTESLIFLSADIIEENDLSLSLAFSYQYDRSTVDQRITFFKEDRRIDFDTTVNWQERQKLLKVGFDVDVRATEATFDIQYGNVKRPTHWNTSWDMARFESVAHQWVDLSDRTYGVSLLNDCKYGHDVKENRIGLTLLKGGIYPDPSADRGIQEFRYSLYPHSGDFVAGGTVEAAWACNQSLTVFDGKRTPDSASFFTIVSDYPVVIDAIKPSENGEGIILRIHDHIGAKRVISFKPAFTMIHWFETNLMEEPLDETKHQADTIRLNLEPFEIKTIFIKKLDPSD